MGDQPRYPNGRLPDRLRLFNLKYGTGDGQPCYTNGRHPDRLRLFSLFPEGHKIKKKESKGGNYKDKTKNLTHKGKAKNEMSDDKRGKNAAKPPAKIRKLEPEKNDHEKGKYAAKSNIKIEKA